MDHVLVHAIVHDGKPCMHMIVLAKVGHINDPGFTRLSVMTLVFYIDLEKTISKGNCLLWRCNYQIGKMQVLRTTP
jgi:hypothetical protein